MHRKCTRTRVGGSAASTATVIAALPRLDNWWPRLRRDPRQMN